MSARIHKRGERCDKCSGDLDTWAVEVIDPDTHTVLCPKHFEQTMKHWRKADALVKELETSK